MKFDVKRLLHAKQEYESCEDAESCCEDWCDYDDNKGLFAISDGLGALSFSNQWSRTLVGHFLHEPLRSNDPFEVQYWLRGAQRSFRPPVMVNPKYYALKKAREGSAATFLGVRFTAIEGRTHGEKAESDSDRIARCDILTVGDSCAFHYREGRLKNSFPLTDGADFGNAPMCFPTKGYRGRWWQGVESAQWKVRDGDVIVLATDAVSQWLLHDSHDVREERFRILDTIDNDHWPGLLHVLRHGLLIRDDDSTALVIRMCDSSGTTEEAKKFESSVKKQRQRVFTDAYNKKNAEIEMALAYGDGRLFQDFSAKGKGTGKEIGIEQLKRDERLEEARRVTTAHREICEAIGRNVRCTILDLGELQRLYDEYRDVLGNCDALHILVESLKELGVNTEDSAAASTNEELHPSKLNQGSPDPGSRQAIDSETERTVFPSAEREKNDHNEVTGQDVEQSSGTQDKSEKREGTSGSTK